MTKAIDYIEERDGGLWIVGTRVSLDSIVHGFREGESAETIAQNFPVLTLEQVYGAIAYYLGHRRQVDQYLEAGRQTFEVARQTERDADPHFYAKIARARALRSA